MNSTSGDIIATRELLFSSKGESVRSKVTIAVYKPIELQNDDVNHEFSGRAACCRVVFDGLDEPDYLAHGADTLQALELAMQVDTALRRLSRKYDFYFETGEDYFEE